MPELTGFSARQGGQKRVFSPSEEIPSNQS